MAEFDTSASGGAPAQPPLSAEQLFQRGLQQQKSGRYQAARVDYIRALEIEPDHFGATYLIGLLFYQTGNNADAEAYITKATVLNPEFAEAHSNLGTVLQALGRFDEAIMRYQTALQIAPEVPENHYNCGLAHTKLKRFNDAINCFKRAIDLKPDYASAHNSLGNAYHKLGRLKDALARYRNVVELEPDHRDGHFNIASVLAKQTNYGDAEKSYQRALEIDPSYVEAMSNLGNIYAATGQQGKALELFDKAIEINPHLSDLHGNRGNTLRGMGRTQEAIKSFKAALAIDPDNWRAHSSMIFTMGYAEGLSADDIKREADRWNRRHAFKDQIASHTNDRDPDRRLHIGLVSGDLCHHPVSSFLTGILPELNGDELQLTAYSNSYKEDQVTARLKTCFAQWRDVAALEDRSLADLVRSDGIDILIDLSGHTADHRLRMFTLRPAPVQFTWLGYGGTTGLDTMDYVLGDRHVIPPGNENHFAETPWHLPDVWVSFTPPRYDLQVSALPALENGFVTFASFNSLTKITEQTVSCWAQVLKAVPDSRLLLKAIQLNGQTAHDQTFGRFERHGITRDRITLKGRTTRPEKHLADYHHVDIALDPFPYAGGTTSVEAFWMGVPVLAQKGDRFVANMGVSLGQAVGLQDWIADSVDDYVGKAKALASDLEALAELRARLRPQMLASPLCDSQLFARNFEQACRAMWRKWCGRSSLPPGGGSFS